MNRKTILKGIYFCCSVLLLGAALNSVGVALPQEELDNARIMQLTKMGLGDDIIIAKIKTGNSKFALGDSDLAALKSANVSDKVVAAMLEASVLTSARVKIDGNPVDIHTLGQAKVGGRLGHKVSMGIKSTKEKAYLQGQHAAVVASSSPTIEVELPPTDSIDNYIIVKLDGKGDRRELEVGSVGGSVGGKSGIRAESIEKSSYEPLGPHRFKVSVHKSLKGGEYIVYVVGSADYEKGIFGRGYDFTVE